MFNRLRFTLVLCCLCVGAYASQVKQTQIDPMMADAIDFFKTYQDLKDLGFSLETLSPDQRKTLEHDYGEKTLERITQIQNLFDYYCISQYNLHWSSSEYDKQIVKALRQCYGAVTEDDMNTVRRMFFDRYYIPFPQPYSPTLLKNPYFPAQNQSDFRSWYTLSDGNWGKLKDEFMSFAQSGHREKRTTLDMLRQKHWNTILPIKYSNKYSFSNLNAHLFSYFSNLRYARNTLLIMACQSTTPMLNQYAEQRFVQLLICDIKALYNSNNNPDSFIVFIGLNTLFDSMKRSSFATPYSIVNKISTDPSLLSVHEKEYLVGISSAYIPILSNFALKDGSVWRTWLNKRKDDYSFQSFQKWNRLFEQINHPLRVTEKGELLLPKSEVDTIEAYPKYPPGRGSRSQLSLAQPKSEVTK